MTLRILRALNASGRDGREAITLDAIAPARIVAAILAYAALLLALRLSISPFLEIDEAQFMGAVDLRFVYDNSHPPLINWLVRGALELTGWNWPLALGIVRSVLLAATHLLVFDAARRLGGTAAGILAVACAMLMPQVSWMSAHTLAHSVLAMAAAAGVVHAVVLVFTRGGALPFVALGTAAAVGMMGKYNVAILLLALAVAVASVRRIRARFARPEALLAPLTFIVLAGPGLVMAATEPAVTTERMAKLYRVGPFAALDVPGVGVDGLLSLAVAVVASAGVVLALVALFGRAPVGDDAMRRVLWRTVGCGLAGFAVFVLLADMSLVHERYLTPLLMPLPVVAALHLAGWRLRRLVAVAGVAAALAVPLGIVGMVAFDNHRWARPYEALGAAILSATPPGDVVVASTDYDPALPANIALALRALGRTAVVADDRIHPHGPILVQVWSGRAPVPDAARPHPPGACEAARLTLEAPNVNLTDRTMAVTVGIYAPAACRS
jgi:4-amino-4-deoxy-L-arabinose transferase-like glycosyltransferase